MVKQIIWAKLAHKDRLNILEYWNKETNRQLLARDSIRFSKILLN